VRAIAAAGVVVALAIFFIARIEPDGVRITVLPVGQGDGAVFELPTGEVIVVDAGGNVLGDRDPGADVVLPFLKRRGIEAIDLMILSHPHPDHGKGLVAVAKGLPVKEIWHPGALPEDPIFSPLISAAAGARIRSTPDILGAHAFGAVRLEVLAPAPKEKTPSYPELGANDNSLVIRICLERSCALWPGDVEELGEELLIESGVDIKAQLVKAPHHGSSTSSIDDFVKRTGAEHVIMCTGRGNTFGFPHSVVVERWRAAGAKIWDTAQNGEVAAWLSDAGIRVRAFRH
jgi:competence protein ComEC